MERLTDEVLHNAIKTYEITSEIDDPDYSAVMDKCILEFLHELKAYRDAEEQGLLIRLPFAVGDIVYWVSDVICPFEVKDVRIDKFGINVRFAYCGTEENKRYWEIVKSIDVIGGKVFLTREEAEAALERMNENA